MKTTEQINKIEAVVLYILQHFKDGIDYIKLFKIMYFAQREYLATYGLTIAEDTFKARQLGPVPSLTYKVVKMVENGEESEDLKHFTSSIHVNDEKKIYANESPDMDYIAEMEKEELQGFYPEFTPYEKYCKFTGCSHISEPVCGVKDALERGDISRVRYENYKVLYEEIKNRKKY